MLSSQFLALTDDAILAIFATMNIAQRVIDKCGGPAKVAEMVGVHQSRVYRWTYPKDRGGTGGTIPSKHQEKLLNRARRRGINLSPADFFEAA